MSESSAGKLTSEQVEHFRTVFSMFDEDGGGSIDVTELKMAVSHLGCDADEAESLFYAVSFHPPPRAPILVATHCAD